MYPENMLFNLECMITGSYCVVGTPRPVLAAANVRLFGRTCIGVSIVSIDLLLCFVPSLQRVYFRETAHIAKG